ncbi:MAG: hypothetical protein SGJ18_05745 [Pseudomonadota bacterium]|nr:hypothetical protein [Pseudomonadota bacterium]
MNKSLRTGTLAITFLVLLAFGFQNCAEKPLEINLQNQGSNVPLKLLSDCDVIPGNTSQLPFSSCGVYDGSNQVVCSCSHTSQRLIENFFTSSGDREHWLSVYPNNTISYNGPTQYTNTGLFKFMVKYTY